MMDWQLKEDDVVVLRPLDDIPEPFSRSGMSLTTAPPATR